MDKKIRDATMNATWDATRIATENVTRNGIDEVIESMT